MKDPRVCVALEAVQTIVTIDVIRPGIQGRVFPIGAFVADEIYVPSFECLLGS